MRVTTAIVITVFGVMATLNAQSPTTIKKIPLKPTAANSGKDMFANYCASCHGADGQGQGPAAAALKTAPPNLTRLAANANGKFPEDHVNVVLSGLAELKAHGSSEMPIWGELFKSLGRGDNEIVRLRIANVTDYLRSIQTK